MSTRTVLVFRVVPASAAKAFCPIPHRTASRNDGESSRLKQCGQCTGCADRCTDQSPTPVENGRPNLDRWSFGADRREARLSQFHRCARWLDLHSQDVDFRQSVSRQSHRVPTNIRIRISERKSQGCDVECCKSLSAERSFQRERVFACVEPVKHVHRMQSSQWRWGLGQERSQLWHDRSILPLHEQPLSRISPPRDGMTEKIHKLRHCLRGSTAAGVRRAAKQRRCGEFARFDHARPHFANALRPGAFRRPHISGARRTRDKNPRRTVRHPVRSRD